MYLSVSLKGIINFTTPILKYRLVWYYPSKSIIIVNLLIYNEIHASYDSRSIFHPIHVSTNSFHIFSRHCGDMLSGEIVLDDPWNLTRFYTVCSINAIIVHYGVCYACDCLL